MREFLQFSRKNNYVSSVFTFKKLFSKSNFSFKLTVVILTVIISFFEESYANWLKPEKDHSFDQLTVNSESKKDSLPSGISREILKALRDENGHSLIAENNKYPGEFESDAIQERFFTGYAADDFFGYSVSDAGDVNGDGYDDIIIGSPQNDAVAADAGRAYIYFGGNIINSGVDVILSGVTTGDKFGWSVAGAGDVNNDGFDDVIVGAPFNDIGGTDAGRAYIFLGGSPMNNIIDITLTGSNAQDNFGLTVSGAGDVNANGFPDVIVGAPGNDGGGTNAGRAQIYFGGNPMNNAVDITINGLSAQDNFASSVADAGDVNGDGFADIISGAPNNDAAGSNAGRAYVYLGGNPMNTTADMVLTGATAGDNFGYSVSGNGDVNGDGYSDVIAGAFANDAGGSNSGSVYLYYGGASLDNTIDITLIGISGEYFGYSVSLQGDLNGDGYSDVIAGAPNNGSAFTDAGRAYVYNGGSSMDNVRDAFFTGDAASDNLGYFISFAGDMNGDGYTDIIAGAPFNNAGGAAAGKVKLYLNSMSGNDIADEYFNGNASLDYFGSSVSSAGDVNGDGYGDIIIGAPLTDTGGTNTGRAYLFFGGVSLDNVADVTLTGEAAHDNFGSSVSGAGDVNGDGYSDVIVSAPSNDAGGTNTGRAYIFFGGASMNNISDVNLTGFTTSDFFGASVSGAGDVNGDGLSDVIVGVPDDDAGGTFKGRSYIYFGGTVMNNVADVILTGEFADDFFGNCVSNADDVNGDGYDDVIIGAYSNDAGGTDAGRAYIFFGGASMNNVSDVTFTAAAASDNFGISVSCAGDFNGDGYSDVIISATYNDAGGTNAGSAYIYLGGSSMNNIADINMTGDAANDYFGYSVSGAGDVNGDGYSDVIISAPDNDAGETNAGRAYIFLGGSSINNVKDITMTGYDASELFGISVSGAGDINNDGISDLIVSTPYNDDGGTDAGKAYLYLSSSPPVNPRIISAKDIPYDQGGKLKLKWVRSGNDIQGAGTILNYLIEQSPPPGITGFTWSPVLTVPAAHNTYYSYNVNTDNDSMSNNSGAMYYRITAQTSNSNEYWRSNIMSGYSVDNLAPFAPQNLAAAPDNNSVYLSWDQNQEEDFHHYIIYRNGTELGTANITNFDDVTVAEDSSYDYNIAGVDIHGNISPLSNTVNIVFNTSGSIALTVVMEGFYNAALNNMIISDTAKLYLRNSTSPYSLVDSSAGIIDANTLTGSFTISNAPSGNYYLAVKHRNALETWSGSAVSYVSGSDISYNFSTAQTQAYGNNMMQADAAPLMFAVFSGDVNQDGFIDLSDVILTYNDASSFVTGYKKTDINGDNITDLSDLLFAYNNSVKFVSLVRP